jgi:WD40 repeat protein
VIDKENNIITIDLRTKSIRHVLPAQAIITSQTYCSGTDWLFIGYANGFIDVFDIMQGIITPYQIPDLLESQEEAPQNHIVVDLQMHPTELNTLLIGYECTVFIWNIRENTIRRSYSLRKLDKANPYRNANLTCLAWSPNGSRFIGGYDDGCIHLWEVKNEHKPLSSRKLSESFLPPTEDQSSTTDPIYQVAWYASDVAQKSYIVLAGGLNPTDIQGLNVLEFDLESESREAKKQTIMPLPTDLSHFLILATNPFYSGLNPSGIAVIGADHCLRVYSLEHGFPLLKLPPALEFLGPNVLNACHIPHLPSTAFKKLTGITLADRSVRYLPITGGVAGPEHVYHIDANDLLLTIHQGEWIKCWDASYTALRPLSQLTIHCLEDLEDKDAFLCCLDINKNNGALAVGFSDGSVLIYEYHSDPEPKYETDPRILLKNQEIIDQCDDTLKEISGLLEDMGPITDSEEVEEHPTNNPFIPNPPPPQQEDSADSTNPFHTSSPTHQQQPKHENEIVLNSTTPQLPPRNQSKPSIFKKINKTGETAGFYAYLKMSFSSPIKSVLSLGESL